MPVRGDYACSPSGDGHSHSAQRTNTVEEIAPLVNLYAHSSGERRFGKMSTIPRNMRGVKDENHSQAEANALLTKIPYRKKKKRILGMLNLAGHMYRTWPDSARL